MVDDTRWTRIRYVFYRCLVVDKRAIKFKHTIIQKLGGTVHFVRNHVFPNESPIIGTHLCRHRILSDGGVRRQIGFLATTARGPSDNDVEDRSRPPPLEGQNGFSFGFPGTGGGAKFRPCVRVRRRLPGGGVLPRFEYILGSPVYL